MTSFMNNVMIQLDNIFCFVEKIFFDKIWSLDSCFIKMSNAK